MKKILIILIVILSNSAFSQSNYAKVINESFKKHDKSKTDSIARSLGYKGGDKIKVFTLFKVNNKGEIFDIKARGPHQIFEEEAIRVVSLVPKLDPNENLKEGESMKFTLPITFVIETDSEKKKRERKEEKERRKMQNSKNSEK